MLFRFKGDYTGKRTSITLFGVTFEGREPADVTDEDGIRRLSNHPEFEQLAVIIHGNMAEAPKPTATEVATAVAEFDPAEFRQAGPKKRGRPRKGS